VVAFQHQEVSEMRVTEVCLSILDILLSYLLPGMRGLDGKRNIEVKEI
jgi:hypothetical protein